MNIIKKDQVNHVQKPDGPAVWYYLRDEYEIHYNEQPAGVSQDWHHHEIISETLYLLEGELTAEWKEGDEVKSRIVRTGDLIETERTPHTFTNHTDSVTKFLVFKFVPTGKNQHEVIKSDKVSD